VRHLIFDFFGMCDAARLPFSPTPVAGVPERHRHAHLYQLTERIG